jgi:hypothetical protein
MQEQLSRAKDLHDLYAVIEEDFWCVAVTVLQLAVSTTSPHVLVYLLACPSLRVDTKCYSEASPGHVYVGTRLEAKWHAPRGFDFGIRTPGTPSRYALQRLRSL